MDNPDTWGSFGDAYTLAATTRSRIGLVLTATDPYCIIDLDDKLSNPATENDKILFAQILSATTGTYQEMSRSGRGYHIVCTGLIPDGIGRHRGHVEIYDRSRFMIFTGACNGKPILNQQYVINELVASMPRSAVREIPQDEVETLSDREVVEIGLRASNGEKFNILTANGELWRNYYESQSDADYALLGMLWFYSRNVEQTIRIFRLSPLGQREKAQRNDYVLGSLERIRMNEPPEVNLTMPTPKIEAESEIEEVEEFHPAPGIVGRLAEEFMQWSTRPVLEIATAAALGAITGIVARGFNYSGTGLNQYIFLLSKTGRGKEGLHVCVNRLFHELQDYVPGVMQLMGPGEFASAPGVHRMLSRKPSCLSIVGEFSEELDQMTNPKNVQKNGVKKVLLNIYNKSGVSNVLHGSAYSDVEKNIEPIRAPALTILGECTVEGYYRGMDLANIDNGLIPRFLSIQYHGKRVSRKKDVKLKSDTDLLRYIGTIATCSINAQEQESAVQVHATPEAEAFLDDIDSKYDDLINNSSTSLSVELQNRAHFKCIRCAAVLAVADNPNNPVITKEHAEWAEWLVTKDLNMTMERFDAGDIGTGDSKQLADLRRSISDYFQKSENELVTAYSIPPDLVARQLIPYIYLQRRTSGLASYKNDRNGATLALKRGVEELVATGEIQEIPKSQAHAMGYTGRLFFVKQGLKA